MQPAFFSAMASDAAIVLLPTPPFARADGDHALGRQADGCRSARRAGGARRSRRPPARAAGQRRAQPVDELLPRLGPQRRRVRRERDGHDHAPPSRTSTSRTWPIVFRSRPVSGSGNSARTASIAAGSRGRSGHGCFLLLEGSALTIAAWAALPKAPKRTRRCQASLEYSIARTTLPQRSVYGGAHKKALREWGSNSRRVFVRRNPHASGSLTAVVTDANILQKIAGFSRPMGDRANRRRDSGGGSAGTVAPPARGRWGGQLVDRGPIPACFASARFAPGTNQNTSRLK